MSEQNTGEKKLPWPIILMLSMLALVIGLGFVLSPKSEADKIWWVNLLGTTNHGVLLNPPVSVTREDLRLSTGEPWSALENETFKLVVIVSEECDQRCKDMLLSTRQLHVRLNRDYSDVERGFLPLGMQAQNSAAAIEDLDGYSLLSTDGERFSARLRETNIPSVQDGPVLLMLDAANLAMMAYTETHSGSEVLEDLEHLLELAR